MEMMMTDTKFTPGPWAVSAMGSVHDVGERVIAPCALQLRKENVEWANAHLIAAAPDLYAALDEVAQILAQCTFSTIHIRGQYVDREESVLSARAALAKARGAS